MVTSLPSARTYLKFIIEKATTNHRKIPVQWI
jgi:hypothetical protein